MNFFSQLSLKSKLVYMLLGVALGCIVVVGYQGLTHGKEEITHKVYDQLTSIREAKSEELRQYFGQINSELKSLANNPSTVGALREFESAFTRLENETISDGMLDSLAKYYDEEFLPELQDNIDGQADRDFYLPAKESGKYLQYQYISNSEHPRGDKKLLDKALDKSYYSSVHQFYHPTFREQLTNSGYYDLFLISLKTGNIVYSVEKETDFATSLEDGPYSNTNLAELYRRAKASQDKGSVIVQDFDFYRPSYNTPAGFLGTVIYDGNNPIGVLAIQIPIRDSAQGNKFNIGLTGEVVIAGHDTLMRTNARSLRDTVNCYRIYMPGAAKDKTSERICRTFDSILLQSVDNAATRHALEGNMGTAIIRSYYGEKVLASYGPIGIDGLDWVMMAQMEVDEANQPVYDFQRDLTLATVLLGCAVTFIAMWLSNIFTRPMVTLMEGVKRLRDGDLDVKIDLNRKDEFGQLAETINQTMTLLREKNNTIDKKQGQNDKLLRNILPDTIAQRVKNGDNDIADRIDNVSVLFSNISGFTAYAETLTPTEAVKSLNELVNAFDAAAEKHGVEKVKTIGDNYMACCGLTVQRLDHAKRIFAFAREMQSIVEAYSQSQGCELATRTGIHSGSVIAGIVGETRFVYDIWGESVNVASRLRYEATQNTILVTDNIHQRLVGDESFVQRMQLNTIGYGPITVWDWDPDGTKSDDENAETDLIVRPEFKGSNLHE